MGTTFALDVRDSTVNAAAVDRAFAMLRSVDRIFSTWRPESEVSRIARGELLLSNACIDVQDVFDHCEELYRRTGGFFDMRYRRDGTCDPTGLVKGWALEHAAGILTQGGARNFSLNGGGDVVVRGAPSAGHGWRLGIRHPGRPDLVAAVVEVSDAAVATSGNYERGDHIVDPHNGQPATGLLSATVVGPSMTVADAYATATFAMGPGASAWLADRPDLAACVITSDGRVRSTRAFQAIRVA